MTTSERLSALRAEWQHSDAARRAEIEVEAAALAATPPKTRSVDAGCCGEKYDWLTAGAPLVNACQLCPVSPSYWRLNSVEKGSE